MTVVPAQKLRSGLEPLDRTWGGLSRAGSYLVLGRPGSDHDRVVALLLEGAPGEGDDPERPLVVTPEPSSAHSFRIALPPDRRAPAARLPGEIAALARRHRPARLVVEDLAAYLPPAPDPSFRAALVRMLEELASLQTTVVLGLTLRSGREKRAAAFLRDQVSGVVRVERIEGDASGSTERRLTLSPNVGPLRRRMVAYWDLRDAPGGGAPYTIRETVRTVPRGTEGEERPSPRRAAAHVEAVPLGRPAPATPIGEHAPDPAPEPAPERDAVEARQAGWSHRPTYYRAPAHARPDVPAAETRRALELTTGVAIGAEAGPTPPPRPAAPAVVTERETFRSRLQLHFLRRDVNATPFSLVALRLDRSAAENVGPIDFEFLIDLSSEGLDREDVLYADAARERIVVLFAARRPDATDDFFGRLRQRLQEEAPQKADTLLNAVATIVVPDGRPFQHAEEFLAFALGDR